MAEIVGVRFKNAGKTYYFDPAGHTLQKGDLVVVETTRGLECGEVAIANRTVDDETVVHPLKAVVRPATDEDKKRVADNEQRRKKAMKLCQERIDAHHLDMKLVDAEYAFDNSKLLFYFTADGRVDFRELVRDLASAFRTRIELRQIGVRDEAKMLGGLGICGRPFCCSQFLNDFQPVSIKMAKEQGLSLNPTKISGSCGRLMCCLKYEQEAYESLLRATPKVGAVVQTEEGRGVVTEVSLLTGMLKVRLDKAPDSPPVAVAVASVKTVRGNGARPEKTDKGGADAPREKADKAEKADKTDSSAAAEAAARPEKAERSPKTERGERQERGDRPRGPRPPKAARGPKPSRPKAPTPATPKESDLPDDSL